MSYLVNNEAFTNKTAVQYDPILILIKKYRNGIDEYNALPPEMTDNAKYREYTWLPWSRRIESFQEAALSEEGAIAAINLASDELIDSDYSPIVKPLLKAATKYFNRKL